MFFRKCITLSFLQREWSCLDRAVRPQTETCTAAAGHKGGTFYLHVAVLQTFLLYISIKSAWSNAQVWMLMPLFVLFPAAGAVYLHICSEQSYVKFKTQKVRLKCMCMHLIKVHYGKYGIQKKIWQQRILHYYKTKICFKCFLSNKSLSIH